MSLKVWSYCLEMVSLVENHRSCRVSRANWKQDRAKEAMDASTLNCPCKTPGPQNRWIGSRVTVPSAAVNTSSAVPGPGTLNSAAL